MICLVDTCYGLHSSRVGYRGIGKGSTIGVTKGDTRSVGYNPYNPGYSPSVHFIFIHFPCSFPFDTPLLKGETRSLDPKA